MRFRKPWSCLYRRQIKDVEIRPLFASWSVTAASFSNASSNDKGEAQRIVRRWAIPFYDFCRYLPPKRTARRTTSNLLVRGILRTIPPCASRKSPSLDFPLATLPFAENDNCGSSKSPLIVKPHVISSIRIIGKICPNIQPFFDKLASFADSSWLATFCPPAIHKVHPFWSFRLTHFKGTSTNRSTRKS